MIWQYTFWLGAGIWIGSFFCTDTRYELGRTGPYVHVLTFMWIATLVAMHVRRLNALAATPTTLVDEAYGEARARAYALAAATFVATVTFMCFTYTGDASEFGIGSMVVAIGVPVAAAFVLFAARRARLDGMHDWLRTARHESPFTTLLCLAPLLLPVAMFTALATGDAGEWWDLRISPIGRAGIANHLGFPWRLVTALLAAWGIDRLFGTRALFMETAITAAAVLATLVLGIGMGYSLDQVIIPRIGADHAIDWMTGFNAAESGGPTVLPRGHLAHSVPLVYVTAGLAVAFAFARQRRRLIDGVVTSSIVVMAALAGSAAVAGRPPWIAADVVACAGLALCVFHGVQWMRERNETPTTSATSTANTATQSVP